MLAKNLDVQRGLVNGARGVVKGFEHGNKGRYYEPGMSKKNKKVVGLQLKWDQCFFKNEHRICRQVNGNGTRVFFSKFLMGGLITFGPRRSPTGTKSDGGGDLRKKSD